MSSSQALHEIDLILGSDTSPRTFIITKLKDAYNGILHMPWLQQHGQDIDWPGRRFRMPQGAIAAEEEASSIPKTALENGHRPQGEN
ncbi:hypothetical protein PSTT_06942 [Puccinia striiformis]|uniref:Uncharacterized protein n=1 Tax=Puccinia striiformis TaxID=27350 RepID=A0A2S4VIC9_9BASI|nr:hypothetical protein PSTT_06942 [Puccinia striiformis]